MKNKRLKALIQKPLRFHHQDIHEEIDELKKHQVKSKWYYIFWGAMAVAVVGGKFMLDLVIVRWQKQLMVPIFV